MCESFFTTSGQEDDSEATLAIISAHALPLVESRGWDGVVSSTGASEPFPPGAMDAKENQLWLQVTSVVKYQGWVMTAACTS